MDFSIKFRTKGDVVLKRTLLAKGCGHEKTLLARVIHCGIRPQPQRKKKKKNRK